MSLRDKTRLHDQTVSARTIKGGKLVCDYGRRVRKLCNAGSINTRSTKKQNSLTEAMVVAKAMSVCLSVRCNYVGRMWVANNGQKCGQLHGMQHGRRDCVCPCNEVAHHNLAYMVKIWITPKRSYIYVEKKQKRTEWINKAKRRLLQRDKLTGFFV